MVVKAGLRLIGLSAISIGGVALGNPSWLGMDTQPKSTTLAEDHDYSSKNSEYQSKFGETNANKLVGVSGKKADENKDWWEWSFERLKKDNPQSGKFSRKTGEVKVTKGYAKAGDSDLTTALNQVCYAAYKEESGKIKNADTVEEGEYKESEVWKYCARPGAKDAVSA